MDYWKTDETAAEFELGFGWFGFEKRYIAPIVKKLHSAFRACNVKTPSRSWESSPALVSILLL
jgi:hypothetical protein